MELDSRLDAYAELVGSYARNSVSLEHVHMVSRGSTDGYYKVAKYEIQGRKISNRMDEILAIMMQDNAYREQAKNPLEKLFFFLKKRKKMPYFSLEVCVCSGKSTVLKFIVPFLRKERRLCDVVPKPFSLFTDYQDQTYNPLTEMQHDAMRNIFPGQLHILKKSANYFSSCLDRDPDFTMISDRSIFSCYSFIDCYFREGYFSRFSKDYLINEWWDRCNRAHKPDCFIFLDAPPCLVLEVLDG